MPQIYQMRNAFMLNTTGKKVNAIASPVKGVEILKHKGQFGFDFYSLYVTGNTVYKLCDENQPDILQGLVAFRHSPGVLDCANMETNLHNRYKSGIYNLVGKAMVALCCKYSLDNGMDGCIAFESKSKLAPYYKRLGAFYTMGNRMAIDEIDAQKLINQFF